MENSNLFKIRHGNVELELAGDAEYIKDVLQDLPRVLVALQQAPALQVPADPNVRTQDATSSGEPLDAAGEIPEKTVSLAEFLSSKATRAHIDRVVCVAYYMENFLHITEYTTKEVVEIWKSSKAPTPANVPNEILRACQKTFLKSMSKDKYPKYQLTTRGEAFVEELAAADATTIVKVPRRTSAGTRKSVESATVKTMLETPQAGLNLEKYPDVHSLKSPIREVCWVMWVARDQLGVGEMSQGDIVKILSKKFNIKRTTSTIATALERNPKAWDRVRRGVYRLMKHGEDLVLRNTEAVGV